MTQTLQWFLGQDTKEQQQTRGTTAKFKNLCSKGNHWQSKRQATQQGKVCAAQVSDKGSVSTLYKELLQINKNLKNLIKKISKGHDKTFLQTRDTSGQQGCLSPHVSYGSTARYHLTPIRTATVKMLENIKCWRGWGQTGAPVHSWWDAEWCSRWETQCSSSSKNYT